MKWKGKKILKYLLAIVLYYVLFQIFYNKVALKTLWPYHGVEDVLMGMAYNFTPIFITFLLNLYIVFSLNKIKNISFKIVIDSLLSLLAMFLVDVTFYFTISPYVDWAGTIFNDVLILLGVEVACYIKDFERKAQEVREKEKIALQYQYDALKAQINPHFLFNSLNILYSLVSIDQQKSKDFIIALSNMYRYIMIQQGKDTVELKEEMAFLQRYVDVLSIRYHNQFDVHIEGEENIKNQHIVPYTMQLLVENATKHNVISNRHHMTVNILIEEDHLSISNAIIPRPSPSVSHVGLNYITELYKLHNKEFYVQNDGVTFTAIVPFIEHKYKHHEKEVCHN